MIRTPQFLDRAKDEFVEMEEFVLFIEDKLQINRNKIYECLFCLGYGCFNNFSIYYNEDKKSRGFSLIIWDKWGEERFSFKFYKGKKGDIKVAIRSVEEETNINDMEGIIKDLKTIAEMLNK